MSEKTQPSPEDLRRVTSTKKRCDVGYGVGPDEERCERELGHHGDHYRTISGMKIPLGHRPAFYLVEGNLPPRIDEGDICYCCGQRRP